ncbi:LOW QUALITY PROTEIN: mitochondrial glutathione transporter SLC25A40 [Podargus strigoides]
MTRFERYSVSQQFLFSRHKAMAEMSDSNLDKTTNQAIPSDCEAIITSLFVTPLDVIKTQLQAQNSFSKGKCFVYSSGLMDHISVCENGDSKACYKNPGHFKGTLDAFVKIIQIEGNKLLWSGFPPTLIMVSGILTAQSAPLLHLAQKMMCNEVGAREPTFLIAFTSGAASGSIAAVITLPFDVVKTHRQTELWESETLRSKVPQRDSTSSWAVMRKIVAKTRINGLFAGIIPQLFKVSPACAIMLSTYEYGTFFSHLNEKMNQRP